VGGKRWLVEHLHPIWNVHNHRRLVEPFCGGLAVALALQPQNALLNDISPHLINFYRWLQVGLQPQLNIKHAEKDYYQCRDRFNTLIAEGEAHSQEAAELFYYLNKTGYNGLCRFNQSGKFNVPFGRHKQINYRRDFLAYQSVLERWEFTCGDFEDISLDESDFIYADPPYDVEFRQYSRKGFDWEDQVRLVTWLAAHPGPVVLSNQATPRIVQLYDEAGFELQFLSGPRRISCNGDRTPAREVLATKSV